MALTARVEGGLPCAECGSSDAASSYEDGSLYCHKCQAKWWSDEAPASEKIARGLIEDVQYVDLPARGIDLATARKWRYGYSPSRRLHVAQLLDATGRIVGQKTRDRAKNFQRIGQSPPGLYGQWLWGQGGRRVVITEGELDALSVSQVLGNKWPVVSLPDGAGSAEKAITEALDWLESYDEVVLMYDQDEPGRLATETSARLLSPGKARVAALPYKDANEMLVAGRREELVRATWEAKVWAPSGIVKGQDLLDMVGRGPEPAAAHWPYPELDERTLGIRRGEILLIAAGIGAGKSTLCRNIVSSFLDQKLKVGVIPLEETVRQFGVGLVGVRDGANYRIDGSAGEVVRASLEASGDLDRLVFYDDGGDRRDRSILDNARYMAIAEKCDVVVIDHLTIVVGSARENDDRRHAERLMSDLEGMVKRTGVILLVVIHLRKAGEGASHESGRTVQMSDVRGSGLIPALCHQIVAYERNQQDDDREKAWVGKLRVLKARLTGRTGAADRLRYDEDTGRLVAIGPERAAPPIEEIKPGEDY